jgi:serine/threonine protein kinase
MAVDSGRVKTLFQAAIEHKNLEERKKFLDEEIDEDEELRDRMSKLLAAYDNPIAELDNPLIASLLPTAQFMASASAGDAKPLDLMGSTIGGRYKIRQKIGEGGMGTVYLAEQLHPMRRQVALKLINPGMDSRVVLARFESERQALAMMDHPNIARVLDGGTTASGLPYFVMDLVKGISLTDYCKLHELGLAARLELFQQICSAIHHAHQKGIIHRDLKPTNILIESHDGVPSPRVIDFGLAKAMSGTSLSEHSLFTAFGSVTGTPLYMAPEQASFNALDIDTRADIYALGVVLYELLTGTTPIQHDTLQRAALDEMFRVIRELEPPTPSSRLSTVESPPVRSGRWEANQSRLSRQIKGDLDWIVMKALAKERNRRYGTALDLAGDIERFIKHEPVTAGPPNSFYRLRKFVRRHRGQVVSAVIVLIALVAGVTGTSWGLVEARRQEQLAIDSANEKGRAWLAEAEQHKIADAERIRADLRMKQVTKMNEILCAVFQDLSPLGTHRESDELIELLSQRVEQAAVAMKQEAVSDSIVSARMAVTLGKAQRNLGHAEKSLDLLAEAHAILSSSLGLKHPDTLKSLHQLALSYADMNQMDRALTLFEEAEPLYRQELASGRGETSVVISSLVRVLRSAKDSKRAIALWSDLFLLEVPSGDNNAVFVWGAESNATGADHANPIAGSSE